MAHRITALAFALGALAVAGCNSARTVEGTETTESESTCTRCHGDATRAAANGLDDAAPPLDTRGNEDTASRGVGAHQAHLTGTHRIGAPVACEACHVVPGSADAAGHVGDGVKVSFGASASLGDVSPTWNASSATCTVYCHGATLSGGSAREPIWTKVDGTQVSCSSCHGYPPPRPHPQDRFDCRTCHPATFDAQGGIDLAGGKHLDGQVEVDYSSMGCSDCHGDTARAASALDQAAPPLGTHGERETTEAAVGAHQAHLTAGHVANPIACAQCHVVPSSPAHPNLTVDLAWGGVASADGASPVWNVADATCTVYCHGATLGGGVDRIPVWTQVDGSQRQCNSCHGSPPPSPHPASTQCAACHPGTVEADNVTIKIANGLHVNGMPEANRYHPEGWRLPTAHGYAANANLASCRPCHGNDLAGGSIGISCSTCHAAGWQTNCTFCHGDPQRSANKAAPPVGTQGETASSAPAVGAHQAHVKDGAIRSAVECSECHTVPADIGHVTGRPAAIAFGALATKDVTSAPRYAGGKCSGTYCHGATLGGGEAKEPTWTVAGGTQATCTSCHGSPPPAPHVQLPNCSGCHGATLTNDTTINVAGGKHIDGTVERTTYHPAGWGAPTQHGYAANRDLASCKSCHGSDLAGGLVFVSCSDCHPSGWQTNCTFCHGDASRSSNKPAPPVGSEGETATSARAVGAHQAHLSGSTRGAPVVCTECHALPTNLDHMNGTAAVAFGPFAKTTGLQPAWNGTTCSSTYCHGATLSGGDAKSPEWTKVDGSQIGCNSCHGAPPPSPHPAVTGGAAACSTCHGETVDPQGQIIPRSAGGKHVNGVIEGGHDASWMNVASPGFHAFSANNGLTGCQSCHGATLQGNGSAVACASCHVSGGSGAPWGCTTCHGGTNNQTGAPPKATWGNAADPVRVGAHTKHVSGGAAFDCAVCHPKPADALTAGHIDAKASADVAFSGLAVKNVTTQPSWNRASPTCANVYCHGATLTSAGGSNKTPLWTGGAGQASCGTCHAIPPPFPHPTASADTRSCAGCHPGTVAADGTLIPRGQHIDGEVQRTGGHEASWMDQASTNFHAYSANAGLSSCQLCHGPTLAGSSSVRGCASCHDGTQAAAWGCTMCHGGTQNQTGAPPKATWGNNAPSGTTNVRIGAHTIHVTGSAIAGPIACNECHIKPADPFAATHIDEPTADVVFGTFATFDGSPATWDRPSATCSNTYCHGAKVGGGAHKAPVWTTVDGSQMTCGSCHGAPPPAPHPTVSSNPGGCAVCHPDTVQSNGTIKPGGKHLDGAVDVAGGHDTSWMDQASSGFHAYSANADLGTCQACHGQDLGGSSGFCTSCHKAGGSAKPWGCTMCHGGGQNQTGAPPTATWGNNPPPGTTNVRVGAHTRHVSGNTISNPFACSVCHVTPADATSPGHVDEPTADVTFGGLALSGGAQPTYTRTSSTAATCSNTYCHAPPSVPGGAYTAPNWAKVDGTQATCSSCHGAPPNDGPLVGGATPAHRFHTNKLIGCNKCHDGYDPYAWGAPKADKSVHLDGKRDVRVRSCTLDGMPAYCDPASEAGCVCGVTVINGWNCGQCHALFPSESAAALFESE